VLTGGRGKAAGSSSPDSPDEAAQHAEAILGMDINGHVVRKLWIETGVRHRARVLPLGHVRPRREEGLVHPHEGGRESTSRRSRPSGPRHWRDYTSTRSRASSPTRLVASSTRRDRRPDEQKQILAIIQKLYDAFVGADATLCEINPLIVTPDGAVKALDSKFTVDDNALYKHPDIAEMRDLEAYPPEERAAREKGVTYVSSTERSGSSATGPVWSCQHWT
jgi:succinyl-CoA synthetase beta subunit